MVSYLDPLKLSLSIEAIRELGDIPDHPTEWIEASKIFELRSVGEDVYRARWILVEDVFFPPHALKIQQSKEHRYLIYRDVYSFENKFIR